MKLLKLFILLTFLPSCALPIIDVRINKYCEQRAYDYVCRGYQPAPIPPELEDTTVGCSIYDLEDCPRED